MNFIITTSPLIENRTITEYLGPLISSEVVGVNVISDSIAGLSDFFGGTSGTYRSKLEDLKTVVLYDFQEQARKLNADAIVGFSIAFNEVSGKGKQMFMATATGTAVKLGHNRLEFARKMHELNMYHDEGIFSDSEYEQEISLLKSSVQNIVAIENVEYVEQKRIEAIEKERYEAEHAAALKRLKEDEAKREAERAEESERMKELEAEKELERVAFQKKHAEIIKIIEDEFENHKTDIQKIDLDQINSATYDDILPEGEMSHYDIMRYFVAIGRAPAAAKFYIDKFHLSAQDALQYLSAI